MNKFSEQVLKLNLEIEKVFPEMDSLDIEIEKLNLYKEITEELNEGMSPESAEDDWDRMLPKFQNEDMINIVVAGGDAGKFSAILAGWQSGPKGSQTVTRKIIE